VLRAIGEALAAPGLPAIPTEPADAIVLLGGHARVRAPHAARLWRRGLAPRIVPVGGQLIDGRPGEVRRSEAWLRELGVPGDAVQPLEGPAPGTWEEVVALREGARAHGWSRVIVVTSPYHCCRVAQMLRAAGGVSSVVVGSPDDPYDPAGWWADPRQRRLVRNELLKLGLWRLGLRAAWKAMRA
jgi:uncharacterized SAM-binding protein YcdF (DUF218 family)